MNDYIFDWEENCEKILNGEGYTTKVHQTYEQMVLFKYLYDRGYTKDAIYDIWVKSNSIIIQDTVNDPIEREKWFGKIWIKCLKIQIEKGNEIHIYQSEIDFINNMNVSMWVKQYILAMLCVYKYFGNEWCKYDNKIRRFCYSMTEIKRENNKSNMKKISECLIQYNPYILKNYNSILYCKMSFVSNKVNDKIIISIPNPRYITEIKYLINCERICDSCGNKYLYNYHNKHLNLCPNCYKKQRSKIQYQCKIKSKDNTNTQNVYNEKR